MDKSEDYIDIKTTEIVERIDNELQKKNWKRQVLYDYAGIAPNSFPNWCRNNDVKIPVQALSKIAHKLEVPIDYLITGKIDSGLSNTDVELLRKYHALDDSGKYAVDSILNAMYEKCEYSKKLNLQN